MNVLYLIFNRPQLQIDSFAKIRNAKPSRLFIAADGPRVDVSHDFERCAQARKIVEGIDWPCEVQTRFREVNLGCRKAVVDAINWFFSHVDEGIIIEDDCIASQAFFDYANILLGHYRDDTRVWCISGNNYQNGKWRGDGSYYFSRYSHCWGWATWRRCWQRYDESMTTWSVAKSQGVLKSILLENNERKYWESIFDVMTDPKTAINTWDYQWIYTVIINGGLTACPNRNLVTNIGYGGDGTHCFGTTPDPGIEEFVDNVAHPTFVIPDHDADRDTFYRFFRGGVDANDISWLRLATRKIKSRLSSKRVR
jgi:hypothetical protein